MALGGFKTIAAVVTNCLFGIFSFLHHFYLLMKFFQEINFRIEDLETCSLINTTNPRQGVPSSSTGAIPFSAKHMLLRKPIVDDHGDNRPIKQQRRSIR